MWTYNLIVNNIVRSKYIFLENNKIEILFSNYIFGLTFQSKSEYIITKEYFNFIIFRKNVLASNKIVYRYIRFPFYL